MMLLAQQSTSLIFGFFLMFTSLWQLSLIMMSLLPILVVLFIFQASLVEKIQEESLDALAKAGEIATEIFGLIRIVVRILCFLILLVLVLLLNPFEQLFQTAIIRP